VQEMTDFLHSQGFVEKVALYRGGGLQRATKNTSALNFIIEKIN